MNRLDFFEKELEKNKQDHLAIYDKLHENRIIILKEMNSNQIEILKAINENKIDINSLKVKIGVFSAGLAMIFSSCINIISSYFKNN